MFTYISAHSAAPSTQQMTAQTMYPAGGDVQYSAPPAHQIPPTMVMRPAVELNFSGQCETDKTLLKDHHTKPNPENRGLYLINASKACADEKQVVSSYYPVTSRDEQLRTDDSINNTDCQEVKTDQDKTEKAPAGNEKPKSKETSNLCDCPSDNCDEHEHQDSGCVSDAGSGNSETSSHTNETGLDQTRNQPVLDVKEPCDGEASQCETESQHSRDVYNDDDILELLRQPVFTRPFRNKQNRKTVTPKLVRPIKDIPPRFKKLLEAEAIAQAAALRKNHFEGAPLIRQIMMGRSRRQHHVENPSGTSGKLSQPNFNPNAQCFIPGQPYQCSFDQSNNGVSYSSFASVADACGAGSVDSSVTVSSAPPYTFHFVDGTNSSVAEGYYCECPSNSVCVSSSGTYYF